MHLCATTHIRETLLSLKYKGGSGAREHQAGQARRAHKKGFFAGSGRKRRVRRDARAGGELATGGPTRRQKGGRGDRCQGRRQGEADETTTANNLIPLTVVQ